MRLYGFGACWKAAAPNAVPAYRGRRGGMSDFCNPSTAFPPNLSWPEARARYPVIPIEFTLPQEASMYRNGTSISPAEDVTFFTSVDRTGEPEFFLRFLDEANKLPDVIACKPIIMSGLKLTGGERVLDLGSGLGDDTFEIARLVGRQGRAVGVDVSENMIIEARRRAEQRGINAEFEVGDAQALPFADATFDACRTERLLMHVPDAERALAEMVRVIRPGGRLSVFDFDWDTQFVDSPYHETTRLITRSFCDSFKNGCIGRRLPRLFKQHALTDISVTPRAVRMTYPFSELLLGGHVSRAQQMGTLSPADAERWWTHLREAHEAGTFLYGFTALIVAGVKS
jgi:ubiquinone/menaquinone biosynthesis C-methylase UbiE